MGTAFKPTEVIFAPTARCNLACGHCRVDRARGSGEKKLTIDEALAFLEDCATNEVDRVGFSGGEPFLAPDFLEAVCAKAVELDLYFDRLMTNGVWYRDGEELKATLSRILEAGFDGTFGISVDDWHRQNPERIADFIRTAATLAGGDAPRFDCFEIASALNRNGDAPVKLLESVANLLGAKLEMNGDIPLALVDGKAKQNRKNGMDDGSGIDIPVVVIPYSAGANENAWSAHEWFEDDFCEGPGQVLYVHPDASVAVCCGFGNENDELCIGTVSEGYEKLLANARANPHITDCYEKGLGNRRKEIEAAGGSFPGKTNDPCFFCDWLCKNGLARK